MMKENKNDNIISFRVDPHKKKMLMSRAENTDMKLSEYAKAIILDYLDQSILLDTQKKLREFITESVKDANEQQFYKLLTMINKCIIGIETTIMQNDMTYKYFELPESRLELNKNLTTHPITDVAREQVLKNLRSLDNKKEYEDNDNKDEYDDE